ncbi:MAG: hypothetical protein FJ267_13655, partial [Planctomycetes bacterium]|nr:hypothetical protein [Planctomycetota bacterium]
ADVSSLSDILSREPTPEFAAEVADQLDLLLKELDKTGDLNLRRVALMRMNGFSTSEVAEELRCVRRTVERKMTLIARIWETIDKEMAPRNGVQE